MPKHQKMQKRSQKLQSLQDRQRNHPKSARACEEEMHTLSKEMEERKALFETRFRGLSEKSGDSRKAAAELENEIQAFAGGRRKKRQQCVAIQWMLLRSSNVGAGLCFWRDTGSKVLSKSCREGSELQTLQRKEQEQMKKMLGKEIGMMRRRRMNGMKVIRWILLWILVGVKTRIVEAAEEEISARQEMVLRAETPLAPRLREENMARWKRWSACERG